MSVATRARGENPEGRRIIKPDLRFVAEFQTALYAPEKKAVYVDSWNTPHSFIVERENLQVKDQSGSRAQKPCYISADMFVLREAIDVKVMMVNTLFGFSAKDLVVIKNLGYSVLSPNWNWLSEGFNDKGDKLITSMLSAFSSGRDEINI